MDVQQRKDKESQKKARLLIYALAVFYAMTYILTVLVNRLSLMGISMSDIVGLDISVNSLSGTLGVLGGVACLIMTVLDWRVGGNIAMGLIAVSAISVSFRVFVDGNINLLVGVAAFALHFLSVCLCRYGMKKSDERANKDYLTGLDNRRCLIADLTALTKGGSRFGLLYLDLDNFKYINDTFGHAAGDQVLIEVAARWQETLPKEASIYRVGGDDFIALVPKTENKPADFLTKLACEMIDAVADRKFGGQQGDKYVTASIGIVSYPKDATDPELLVRYADVAMYHGKNTGRNRWVVFDESMSHQIAREYELEAIIREAMDKQWFYLVYQPQFSAAEKKLRGFESLLRLRTDKGEFVSPGEFIPIAEKSDLIFAIDEMVIRRATRDFRDMINVPGNTLTLSVNISAKHIVEPGFVETVKKILEEENFPAGSFEIEITEYCMVESMEKAIEAMNRLKELGVILAMDDFGTGYSSMSYLSRMPIDVLKVDKSLVDNIGEGQKKENQFVNMIISMGHLLGASVIAEGVEDESQLSLIRAAECDYVQGYIWGRPMELDLATELIEQSRK